MSFAATESDSQPVKEDACSSGDELAVSLVEALAATREENPLETDLRLSEYIEPEALDALLSHAAATTDADWTLEFTVDGEQVCVKSDGSVEIK